MKRYIKTGLLACMLMAALLLLVGCGAEQTPYEINDGENYTVSVRYDANGGTFTTNTSVIVDSYSLADLPVNGAGEAEIALLPTDSSLRGNDAFAPINNGHFLAGWYAVREGSEGNYTYSQRWDFDTDRVTVDPSGSYSAADPVLTLYAVWIPMFEVRFCDLATGEYLDSYTFSPLNESELAVPQWNTETGAIEMYEFPERNGYTFNAAYYDAAGTQPVEGAVTHSGAVDWASGTAENSVMTLYVDWLEGDWYHIYNVEQFLDNASVSGSYVIHADLDFTDEIWPSSLMYGNFSGTIQGNGHTFSNIVLEQTNNSKVNAGLFGHLTEEASVTDLTLDKVSFTVKAGSRVTGSSYGLFCGTLAAGAEIANVAVTDSVLYIDSGCYFATEDYVIGLVCGMGDHTAVDGSGITCEAAGDAPETVLITVDGNEVNVAFIIYEDATQ